VRSVWSSLLLAVLAAASPSIADGWRAAPLFGADVRSLAFDPGNSERVLAGTSSGQVYESLDLGLTWSPAGARVALPGWVVSSLAFDPHRPGRVWAGLWALWGSEGAVVVSDDGGRTWQTRQDGLPGLQVYALALAPDRPDEIYAATRQGVWASRDAGRRWRDLAAGRPDFGKVTSLLIDPQSPDTLYAGTWRRAYRSDDRGASWFGVFEGMALDSEVFSLKTGPHGDGDLWASTCGWVYHGRGRGAHWSLHNTGLPERRTPSFEVLAGGALLAGTVAGVYRSENDGASWHLQSPVIAVATIAAHPTRPDVVLVGSEGSGVWRSVDGGRTFATSAQGMVSLRVTDVVAVQGGLALSVRYGERNDGVHRLLGEQLLVDRDGDLPTVLDLAAEGSRLFAATEHGLWRREAGAWQQMTEFGTARVEEVAATARLLAVKAGSQLVLSDGEAIYRRVLAGSEPGLVLSGRSVWFLDRDLLWRWSGKDEPEVVETPAAVSFLGDFAGAPVIKSKLGWFEGKTEGGWRPLPTDASRLLPTGDADLPILALHNDGRAALLDPWGKAQSDLLLPVPSRDVSASILEAGRLHLATAGYGLLWSNVLLLGSREAATASPTLAISSP
jgi:hypothetical protein